jgi:hypothetical protein
MTSTYQQKINALTLMAQLGCDPNTSMLMQTKKPLVLAESCCLILNVV